MTKVLMSRRMPLFFQFLYHTSSMEKYIDMLRANFIPTKLIFYLSVCLCILFYLSLSNTPEYLVWVPDNVVTWR